MKRSPTLPQASPQEASVHPDRRPGARPVRPRITLVDLILLVAIAAAVLALKRLNWPLGLLLVDLARWCGRFLDP